MDDNLIKSILPENLYKELLNFDKRVAELDTCRIPKNSDPIDILNGCVPNMPKFDNSKDINLINQIIEQTISTEQPNFEQQKIECLDVIQNVALNLSQKLINKSQQNQLIPLQKIFLNLIEIVVYNTILERDNKSSYCFKLSLDSDEYYNLIPRIKNYHLQSGIRSYNIHNLFDDIIRSVITKKEYKIKSDTNLEHIIKYYINLNEITESDLSGDNTDFQVLIYSRLLVFKSVLMSVLNEIYYKSNTVKSTLIYNSASSIINTYFNDDLLSITNNKLTTKIKLTTKTVDEIIEYYKSLNTIIQKNLSEFWETIDVFDIEQTKYELVYELSNIPCTKSNKGFDNTEIKNETKYQENVKNIAKNSDEYNIFLPTYWIVWTTYLNIVSLLPTHWTVGFITPVGTPVKLPIIYIHLLTIPIGTTNIIIWLTINGIAISPVIMVVDGKTKSTWQVLFRGGNQLIEESQNSKPIPTGFDIPQYIENSEVIVDTNTKATELALMMEDAFPPMSRMSSLNLPFLKFLNNTCDKGKIFMGLLPL